MAKIVEMRVEGALDDDDDEPKKNDWPNLALLYILYTLQGVNYGMRQSLPLMMAARNASYNDQALFSIASWSFSVKLLWAPIVDAVYIARFGRRKCWLVPAQYAMSLLMLYMSFKTDQWIENSNGTLDALSLAFFFTFLNCLSATQDISLDGWAITLLDKRNMGYFPGIESAGHLSGNFIGFPLLLALESKDISNRYLRSTPQATGIVTLSDFLLICSVVFFIVTTLVMVFKHEINVVDDTNKLSIKDAYVNLWRIVNLVPMRWLSFVLLTGGIWTAPASSMFTLKLSEAGISRDKIGAVSAPRILFDVVFVFAITKWTASATPMRHFWRMIIAWIVLSYLCVTFIWFTPSLIAGGISAGYYAMLLIMLAAMDNFGNLKHIFLVTFFAKISDPTIGATYMTLLNTLSNVGFMWSHSLALWLAGLITFKRCDWPSNFNVTIDGAKLCQTVETSLLCTKHGGLCVIERDGFYIEALICSTLGLVWVYMIRNRIKYLEMLKQTYWRVKHQYTTVSVTIK